MDVTHNYSTQSRVPIHSVSRESRSEQSHDDAGVAYRFFIIGMSAGFMRGHSGEDHDYWASTITLNQP